jgi:PEP-CTERM motif
MIFRTVIPSLGLLCFTLGVPACATTILDSFGDSQETLIASGGVNPQFASNSTTNNAPNAIGGQRELVMRREQNRGSASLDANLSSAGQLSFSTGSTARARSLITYDGPGTGAATSATYNPNANKFGVPDTFGLTGGGSTGGIDLTEGGTNDRIRIQIWSDLGLPLIFTFYCSATNFAMFTLNVPAGTQNANGPVLEPFETLFTDFSVTGGGSVASIFSDTKAITLRLNGTQSGADALLDNFVATAAVPEPSSLSLLLSGGLIIGAIARRKLAQIK